MREAMSRIQAGATTHVGKVRSNNEDNFLVATPLGVWAVADGMGGLAAGDVASGVVVEELKAISVPSSAAELLESCEQRIVDANCRLRKLSDERGALLGTTVAVLLIFETHYAGVWSGDSRIYRIRRRRIEQISVDHSEVQELVAAGRITAEEARAWPRRNVITRAIGVSDHPELDIKGGVLEPGDIFVICSDGLTNHVRDEEILTLASENPPQRACDLLVGLTLDRGATDNVTVVAVLYDATAFPSLPFAAKTGADKSGEDRSGGDAQ
jgi:serine/threonine protein phosphatase PrpC